MTVPFFLFVFAFYLSFSFPVSVAQNLPADLEKIFQEMEKMGAKNIKLIYDWGDGETDILEKSQISADLQHRYAKPGTYIVKRTLDFTNPKGHQISLPIDTKELKADPILAPPGKLAIKLEKDIINAGERLEMEANFDLDFRHFEIENPPRFEWYIDEEYDPYEEGEKAYHFFHIPNGPLKPHYTVTLKAKFRFRTKGQNDDQGGIILWNPAQLVAVAQVEVKPISPPTISEISQDITGMMGKMVDSPIFIFVQYDRIYEDEGNFASRASLLKPRILVGRDEKPYICEFVKVKVNRPMDAPYKPQDFNIQVTWVANPMVPQDPKSLEEDLRCKIRVRVPDPKGQAEALVYMTVR